MCTLYETIKSLCDAKGIKPGKMCTDIGISKSTVTDLKSGRRAGVSLDTAQKIADYFGVTVDRVLGTEQKENPTVKDGEVKVTNEDLKHLAAFHAADEDTKAAIRLLLAKFESVEGDK